MAKKRRSQSKRPNKDDFALPGVVQATNEHAARYIAAPWLRARLQQRFRWHTLFARTVTASASIAKRNISPELFNAYLILGNRWFSHHESIEMLLTTGRYGDCMALLRALLEETDLMTYFSLYPEDAEEWRDALSRAPVWSDEIYKRGIQKFRMPAIWTKIEEQGVEPLGRRDHSILSSTVHASPWGARYYGRVLPTEPDRIYLSLGPVWDAAAAFAIGLVLQETLSRPIEAFLTSCDKARAPRSDHRSIRARYEQLLPEWQEKMKLDSWFRQAMVDVERRGLEGEDRQAVLDELSERYEEAHGADPAEE